MDHLVILKLFHTNKNTNIPFKLLHSKLLTIRKPLTRPVHQNNQNNIVWMFSHQSGFASIQEDWRVRLSLAGAVMIHTSYLQPLLLPLWWLVGVLGYFIYKINAFRTKTQVRPPFTNAVLQSEDLSIEVFKPFYLKDFETIMKIKNLLINGYLGFLLPSLLFSSH